VPVIVPPRVQRRPVEVREVNVSEPNQVKGFLLDLVVVFSLGGLLAGGIYFYNTRGNHSWISPPPTTSVPSIVDDFSPPPLEAEPAKHAHDGTEAISVDDVVEKDLNRKPELILQDEAEVVMPVSTSENDESVGRDDKREDETLPSR
jgi:hypothetical protein